MKMVEVKTAELIGSALDWAVAKAVHGVDLEPFDTCCGSGNWNGNPNEPPECCGQPEKQMYILPGQVWSPSTDWNQGGPILDRHCKSFGCVQDGTDGNWRAFGYGNGRPFDHVRQMRLASGTSILIAACRAIVAAKLGDVVSVPAELVNGGGV